MAAKALAVAVALVLAGGSGVLADEVDLGPASVGTESGSEQASATLYARFWIEGPGLEFVEVHADRSGNVNVTHRVCDDGCRDETFFADVSSDDVSIDVYGGTGTVGTVISGCEIDITVTTSNPQGTEEPWRWPLPGVRSPTTGHGPVVGVTENRHTTAEGAAAGDACGWLAGKPIEYTYGRMEEIRGHWRQVYVRPSDQI